MQLTLLNVSGALLLAAALTASGQAIPATQIVARGTALAAELGCANCHTDLRLTNALRERIPDLSSAGLRYQPAYLFEFLQTPVKVRQHLGRARMPGFHLTQKEALALVAFLETQRAPLPGWPELPVNLQALAEPSRVSKNDFEAELAGGLLCLSCHTLEGKGGNQGVELAHLSYRLNPAWVRMYLVAPDMFGVPSSVMPAQFYRVGEGGRRFQEITPDAARKIRVVADYLFGLTPEKQKALEDKFRAARSAFPDVSAALGEKIFVSQNCTACHRHSTVPPPAASAAPLLADEGLRVTTAWLASYLKRPVPIRPFGFHPGDGRRMPDYRLTDEEAAALSAFLSAQKEGGPALAAEFQPRRLSAFARSKAKALLTDKLSCLGCHRLGQQGGQIGPDLGRVRSRLQPAYVYNVIRDPRGVAPHSIMPRAPLTDAAVQLLANYLLQQDEPPGPGAYLSGADYPLILPAAEAIAPFREPARNYLGYCAPCHGERGDGNGFNAPFLPVRPAAHAKADSMAIRSDDTMYDGIHSGGYILNRSPRMPAWGGSLAPQQIKELVAWIRMLCQCQGPAWSSDNEQRP